MARITSISPETMNHEPIHYRFCPMPTQFLQDPSFTIEEKGFLAVLFSFARPQMGRYTIWPGRETLAKICNLSTRTISRLFKSLEEKGLIERHRKMGTSSRTTIVCDQYHKLPSCQSSHNGDDAVGTEKMSELACKVDVEEVDEEEVDVGICSPKKAGLAARSARQDDVDTYGNPLPF